MRKANKKNIVLIGMSGAGKSTIGIALSYKLHMPFVDTDSYIERKQGMIIPQIFERFGDDAFRAMETDTAKHIGQTYFHTIVSTGGGIILKEENMLYLKQNGIVVYINRSVEDILSTLKTERRPLLREHPERLYDMYRQRHDLYMKYADISVRNNSDFKSGVQNVYDAIVNYCPSMALRHKNK